MLRRIALNSIALNLDMDAIGLKLKQACSEGDLARVRALVEAGADVNATDKFGSGTLLTFHPAVMEYLLSKGAHPNRQTNESVQVKQPFVCGIENLLFVMIGERGFLPEWGFLFGEKWGNINGLGDFMELREIFSP